MSDHRANITAEDKRRRQELGKWIKAVRERSDLSQVDAAKLLGYRFNTTLSQYETAKSPLPPRLWSDMAEAYGMNPREFAMRALKLSEPEVFDMLFGASVRAARKDDE